MTRSEEKTRRRRPAAPRTRRASVLLLVLVVVALVTLATFTFFDLMFNHRLGAENHGQQIQAMALCDSGLEYVIDFLGQLPEDIEEAGGHFDNASRFRGVLVLDDADARYRGRFTFVAPLVDDGSNVSGIRIGLEDESARLNVNTLLAADTFEEGSAREILMALPGMTEAIADAILDWLDPDDAIRQFGAEIDYYSGQPNAYAPTNGPLETVEQLLLVKGVTPELLFGADVNRNGMIDPGEGMAPSIAGIDNTDGAMNRGWSAYLTLYSAEKNLRPDGSPKIDVNMDDLEELETQLTEVLEPEMVNFILAFRQGGPYEGSGTEVIQPGTAAINLQEEGRIKLETILDLVGVRTRAVLVGDTDATIIETPFPDDPIAMTEFLPLLMDNLAANPDETIPGRININQASRTLMLGIPGLEIGAVDQIVNTRDYEVTPERPERRHETWILSEGIVTLEEMKPLMKFINAGGDVYRAQIVGYFDQEGPTARVEAIIDATSTPRMWFWRDLSHLGRGYSLESLGTSLLEE